jgi:hypothetical protein
MPEPGSRVTSRGEIGDVIVEVHAYLDSAMVACTVLRSEAQSGQQPDPSL